MITDLRTIAGYALRESIRRRVLLVVTMLTVGFVALYALGVNEVFDGMGEGDPDFEIAGATMLGLSMFATLFLGTVLGVFLTLNAVRGDAERGLLQPLVVRPVGRTTLLLARMLTAALICAVYAAVVFGITVLLTSSIGGYEADDPLGAGARLALAVVTVVAISMLGTTLLSSTANGIAVFMVFGAGLTAGLLGQIGDAVDSNTLEQVSEIVTWVLPFEALYQDGLYALTSDGGIGAEIVELGPFGGARDASFALWPYAIGYLVVLGAVADRIFRRADL